MTLQTTNDSWEGLIHESFQTYISFSMKYMMSVKLLISFIVVLLRFKFWYLNAIAIRELKNQLTKFKT